MRALTPGSSFHGWSPLVLPGRACGLGERQIWWELTEQFPRKRLGEWVTRVPVAQGQRLCIFSQWEYLIKCTKMADLINREF